MLDWNNVVTVVGNDADNTFHTTNVSNRFIGNGGYDTFMVGSSERQYQADFFFGTDTYNGIEFASRTPDYDSFFFNELWGDYLPSNARVIDPRTVQIDGLNIDFSSQFEGIYVYSGGVEVDANGVMNVPVELARFGAIVAPFAYEDYEVWNAGAWVGGVNSVPGEYWEKVGDLASQFEGFAVYSNYLNFRENPTVSGEDFYTRWRADGSATGSNVLTASMPDPYSFYFFDDITEFYGTDFRDVFYGNPDTNWTQYYGGGGIDLFFGTETGREVLAKENSSVYLKLGGATDLLAPLGALPDNVPDGTDPNIYWRDFGFSISGNIIQEFDWSWSENVPGEMEFVGTESAPESINFFTNFDVYRGSGENDIMVGSNSADSDYEFWGEGGNDILIGGYGYEIMDGGLGDDFMDFGGPSPFSGGEARYRINVTSADAQNLNFKIVSDTTGPGFNKIEVYKGTQLLETFEFETKDIVDYRAASNGASGPGYFEGLADSGQISDIGDFNARVAADAASMGTFSRDVVTATGKIDDRNLSVASADTLINATEIRLAVVNKDTGEWFSDVSIGVDNLNKVFFATSSGVENTSMTDAYVTWTEWEDWRAFGTSGADTFRLDDFITGNGMIIDPYQWGLNVSETWGRIDLGAGNDIVDASTSLGVYGFEIIDGEGSDTYIGSKDGYETLQYGASDGTANGPVIVDAQKGEALDGLGGVDTFANIDQFRLTSQDDIIRASLTERTDMVGMAGDDVFIGAGNAVWGNVRYDQEHFDTRYTDGLGVVVNLSGSNVSYIQQTLSGYITGGVVDAYTARDTFGDTDTFALNEFGERVANVYGSRYHDDVLIGGDVWNSLRGKGGNDYIDGGSGGGSVDYMWDTPQDARDWAGAPALETRGIIANLSEYDLTLTTQSGRNLGSGYNYHLVSNGYADDLDSGTVIDAYGYFDTVKNVNRISGTVENDIVFSSGLAMPEATWGSIYSDVDLGAGNDLLIGDAETAGPNRRVSYNSSEDVYKYNNENDRLPDPSRGLDIDFDFDSPGRIVATDTDTALSFVDRVFGGNPNDDVREALYDAAILYFDAVLADKQTLADNFAYVIADPFVHTDYIFNTSHFAGTSFADNLRGDEYANQFSGLGGDDFVYGAAGDDFLRGDGGSDLLIGGTGQDLVRGGGGNDVIVLDLTEYLSTEDAGALHKELATGDGGYDILKIVIDDAMVWGDDVSLNYADARFDPTSFELLFGGQSAGVNVEAEFWNFERIEVYKASEFNLAAGVENVDAVLVDYANLAESIENAEIAIGGELNDNIVAGDKTRVVFSQDGNDFINVWGYHSAELGNNLRINTGAGNDYISVGPDFKGTAEIERDATNDGVDTLRFAVTDLVDIEVVGRTQFDPFTYQEQNVWDAILKLDDGSTVTLKEALSVDANGLVTTTTGAMDILSFQEGGYQPEDYWAAGSEIRDETLIFNVEALGDIKGEALEFPDEIFPENLSVVSFGTAGNDGTGLAPTRLELETGAAGSTYFALDGDDVVIGTSGDDRLYGGAGNDYLEAADGDDRVYGGAGDDTLSGGRGDNMLAGGTGSDDYRVGLLDGGINIQETEGANDRLILEVASPSSFNWNDIFESVSIDSGSLRMTSRTGNLNIAVDDFNWGGDTIEAIALADSSTGQVSRTFKTAANGIVNTSDTSDYLLVANEAYSDNTLSGDNESAQILAVKNVYDPSGALLDASFTTLNLDELVELSVEHLGFNGASGQHELRVTANVDQTEINFSDYTAGAVEVSGGTSTRPDFAWRETIIMSKSDADALFVSNNLDPDPPDVAVVVNEATLYSKSVAILPGYIETYGYNVGEPDNPMVITSGGAGNDVIFGLDNANFGANGASGASEIILANAGDDTIIAGGGTQIIVGGEGSDTVYLDNKAQKTVVFGDKVGRTISDEFGQGGMQGIENIDAATGEKAAESDTVNVNFTRDQVRINQTGMNTWVIEFDQSGGDTPLFEKTDATALDDIFLSGNALGAFDASEDSLIELHNIENLVLKDGSSFEIGSKGSLRVDLDYDNDNPIIQLFKDGGVDKFRIVTAERTVVETQVDMQPDFFTLTKDTMSGGRRPSVLKAAGSVIEAEPYFDVNGENPTGAVDNGNGTWLVDGEHTAALTEKEVVSQVEVTIPAGTFSVDVNGSQVTEFSIADFDAIEWVGASDGVSRFTRIFDLAAKNITTDQDLFGSDEYGVFYANAEGNVVNYVTGSMANETTMDDGFGIIVGDIIVGTDADETINGGLGDDIIIGKGGDDVLIGSAGDDVLLGGLGDDVLLDLDQAGIEIKRAELAAVQAVGGDTQFVLDEIAVLTDTSDDILVGGQGFDQIDGNGGQDFVSAGDVTETAKQIVDEANAIDGVDDEIFQRIFVYEDAVETS